jgi:hypothetical protein
VLWAKRDTGQAIRWRIEPGSGSITGWEWISPKAGVGAGWAASSYVRGDASTDWVLWTNAATGQAIRWRIDPLTAALQAWGWISAPSGFGAGWQATSYLGVK